MRYIGAISIQRCRLIVDRNILIEHIFSRLHFLKGRFFKKKEEGYILLKFKLE